MRSIIVDIDGTLADGSHREHLIQRPVGERDWDTYYSLCYADSPKPSAITVVNALFLAGHFVMLYSGRVSSTYSQTTTWLAQHRVRYSSLRLRLSNDRTDDHIMKLRWAREDKLTPDNVLFVLEDRQRVVNAWRAAGFTCFQAAPGDF